jgi:hypothetical protein
MRGLDPIEHDVLRRSYPLEPFDPAEPVMSDAERAATARLIARGLAYTFDVFTWDRIFRLVGITPLGRQVLAWHSAGEGVLGWTV